MNGNSIISSKAERRSRLFSWILRLVEYGFVQCWVQAFTALAGLLLVRNMPKDQYALFAIANVIQATCGMLANTGIGTGMTSIGGRVWQDRYQFGQLLTSAFQLRRSYAVISTVVIIPIGVWMLRNNGADWLSISGLTILVLVGFIPQLTFTVLTYVPLLRGEYRRIQKLEFFSALLRYTLIQGLVFTVLNAVLAVGVQVISNWIQLFATRRWAREHADLSAPADPVVRAEILQLSLRSLPNAIFYSIQGQITLVILTLFGNSTGIADITALGRLSALLNVFSAVFATVILPRFARCQDPRRYCRLYLFLVGITLLIFSPLIAISWMYPTLILWILGEKYKLLSYGCGWAVTSGSIGLLGNVLWSLNSSKAWIQATTTICIPLTLFLQIVFAATQDLSNFTCLLIFQSIIVIAPIPLYAIDAFYGLRRRPSDGQTSSIAVADTVS